MVAESVWLSSELTSVLESAVVVSSLDEVAESVCVSVLVLESVLPAVVDSSSLTGVASVVAESV